MPASMGSAAGTIQVTPESAEWYRQQLAVARRSAIRSAAAMTAACSDPATPPEDLIRAADAVLDASGNLRGLAALVRRLT